MNIGVVFGGRSCEREISVITAMQVIAGITDPFKRLIPIYVNGDGVWLTGKNFNSLSAFRKPDGGIKGRRVYLKPRSPYLYGAFYKVKLDCLLMCGHGAGVEDGVLQGAAEVADIPYTSAGVAGSAAGMDKILQKRIFRAAGLRTVKFKAVLKADYLNAPDDTIAAISKSPGYPVVVKPANSGSSIGVTVAADEKALAAALETAFRFDTRVIAERALTDFTEVNCAVLGDYAEPDGITVSAVERPLSAGEILSFKDKYLNDLKAKGAAVGAVAAGTAGAPFAAAGAGGKGVGSLAFSKRRLPADISEKQTETVKKAAVKAFAALLCKGAARVDFLIDNVTDKVYVNEINTVPGSLSYYIWEYSGLSIDALADKLIDIAFKSRERKNALQYSFASPVLGGGGKA